MGLGKTVQTVSMIAYLTEFENAPGPHMVLLSLTYTNTHALSHTLSLSHTHVRTYTLSISHVLSFLFLSFPFFENAPGGVFEAIPCAMCTW